MSDPIEEPSAAATQYLSFLLAAQEYALGILRVKEIIEYDTVTPVPGAPPWVRGVFNLRGSVVPVVDLTVKLHLPPATLTRRSCIVVVEARRADETIVLGVLADAIGQVLDLGPEDVLRPPSFGTPVHADYLLGLGRLATDARFVLLLDIDRVLNAQEIALALAAPPASGERG
jgi:purine-binding chemotaxis protein CheW